MSTSISAAAPLPSAHSPELPGVWALPSASIRRPTVPAAVAAFGAALLAKSPRTAANYQSALRRFAEFLEDDGRPATELTTDELPANVLERSMREVWAKRDRILPTALAAGVPVMLAEGLTLWLVGSA